jgi:two-component system phosphate regulon sensor histidine kinase PhoR
LIDDILFLSSLESGATIAEGVTELGLAAHSVLEKLQPLATKLEVRINADVPAGLKVSLPERMVGTVLSNLIENAIKYSGRGSLVEVGASREGNRIKIVVRDDGIGIDSEHLPHIFERFYRVDKSRSRRLGGTGLGLSIVKHVVESAGGTVSAKSREGFGTEITVLVPQAS